MIGIGIDTGGTCTDAVLYDFETREILGSGKALTTKSALETGIANALDELPQEILGKAEMIALSTTLATNACLENKGARAKLLMIGFDGDLMEHLKSIYASYGLDDRTRFVILDAKVEGLYSNPFDPDWDDLRARVHEYFDECDSVGIVQKHPRANGGRFELTAMKILREELEIPVTISFDISNEVDILKTCAGTLVNARLIPLISEFMQAVHHVMEERGLDIPVSIVRSDGTMMPEETAKMYPVETILCGPAASVVGGLTLAGEENGLIVDMGGTTTDIAIMRDGIPLAAEDGISIGQWKTMVKGLFVETIGLGGDSAVRYKDEVLYLDTVRVIPVSVLASQYDHVLSDLTALAGRKYHSAVWVHEFYVLQKDISGKPGYTEHEQKICGFLKEKPLITMDLADRMGCYPRFLHTERLEAEGVILKSGLTPTDMMILIGDFTMYDGAAARQALRCLVPNGSLSVSSEEEIPDLVYDLVCRRMYHAIGRILLRKQYPKVPAFAGIASSAPAGYAPKAGAPDLFLSVLDCCYDQAKRELDPENADGSGQKKKQEAQNAFLTLNTDLPLIGVGAPIHVFLPRVARLLHTRAVVPSYAGVANALGAAASRRAAYSELIIKAVYKGAEYQGLLFYEEGKPFFTKSIPAAVEAGKEAVLRDIRKKAALQGVGEDPVIEIDVEENRLNHRKDGILFDIKISASAKEA